MGKIADIIKYEGDNSTFIWKHPLEDFNSLTQLIVHESQEAIFFMNGQALDTFGPGRYTLETQNVPEIGKFLNRTTGNDTPFHCEVYFINHAVQMDLKWGTDSKVRYLDPEYGIPLELGASGSMNMCVSDGRKLLIKLVGTLDGISWGESRGNFAKSVQSTFRPMISTAVKSNLTTAIKEIGINIFEIDEHLSNLSSILKSKIVSGFDEYGLTVTDFYITTIVLPEDDSNFKRLRELHAVSLQVKMTEAEAMIRSAQAKAEADVTAAKRQIELERQTTETEIARREAERRMIAAQADAEVTRQSGFAEAQVMKAKGYNEKDVIQAEVQKAFAEGIGKMGGNGSAGGSAMSDIVGLGIGLQAAGTMGKQFGGLFEGLYTKQSDAGEKVTCSKCGTILPLNAKFCFECGEKIVTVPDGMIVCPECGCTVVKGKFCPECGHKFVTTCPSCGEKITSGTKFCPECGAKL